MNLLYLPTIKRFAGQFFLCLFLCLFSFFILPNNHKVLAARYWVGASDGANISDTANWATTQSACSTNGGASVPTTTDLVYFTSSCTNGATINQAFSVLGINVGTGYTATVTQASAAKITIGTSGYTQTDGTFSGSAGTTANDVIDINGSSLSVTGGSFTSTAGVLSIEGSFTVTAPGTFTHHSGTVTFDGTSYCSASTINAPAVTFNSPVTINRPTSCDGNSAPALTIATGTTVPLGSNPTVTLTSSGGNGSYNFINNGTITTGGAGTITINLTSWFTSTFTNNGTFDISNQSALTINGHFINNVGKTISSTSLTTFSTYNLTNSGTITIGNANTITTNGSFTNNAGSAFTPTATPTFNVAGSFVINTGSTFPTTGVTLNLNGSVAMNSVIDAPTVTFTLVTINRNVGYNGSALLTINSGTIVPLGNSPTINLQTSYSASNLTNDGTITVGTGTLTMNLGGTFTNNGTFNISSLTTVTGNGGTIVNNSTITGTNLTTWNGLLSITNNGTITTPNVSTLTINSLSNSSSAVFTMAANPTLNVAGSFVINTGSTFPTTGVTLNLNGTVTMDSVVDAPSVTFSLVTISRDRGYSNGSASITINSGTTIPLGNNSTFNINTGYYAFNFTNNGTITGGTGTFTINIGNGTFTNNGTLDMSSLTTLVINAPFTHSSGAIMTAGAGLNFTVSKNVSISVTSTFPAALNTLTISGSSGTQTYDNPKNTTYSAFVKNATSTLSLSQGFNTGNFTISSGTISNPGSSMTINVSGNFSQTGGTLGGANLPIVFNGAVDKTITQSSGTFSSPFTVSKTSSIVSLATNLTTTGQTCTVSTGTLSLNGKTLVCGSTFTVQNGATLRLIGSETSTTPILNSGSTVEYKGDGDGLADTYTPQAWTYSNFLVNFTDSNDVLVPSITATTTGLVSHWLMDDNIASTVVLDDLGTYNGTASRNTSFLSILGKTNTAFRLNGSSDYVDTGNFGISGNSARTVSLWFRTTVNENSQLAYAGMIGSPESKSTYGSFMIVVRNSECPTLEISAHYWGASTCSGVKLSDLGTGWHQIVLSHQSGEQKIYIDGVLKRTTAYSLNTPAGSYNIGRRQDGSVYFNGDIDEVRVYNKVLSETEVNDLYLSASTPISSLTIGNNFTVQSGTFTAPATLNVAGNFINNGGTFNANGGEVILNGTNQEIQGSTTFNKLTKTVTSPTTLTFPGDVSKLQTFTGAMSLKGTAGNLLTLQSSVHTTQFRIDPQSTRDVEYLAVHDSNNINATSIPTIGKNLTSLGNNTGWNFNQTPNIPSSLSVVGTVDGGYTTNNQPQLVFSLTDPDAADTVKYQIQIDDNSDFSSPVIDYTSGLLTQGLITYSVGQTLTDGSYYWRVNATDNSNVSSNYAVAHSGAVAFIVDATNPSSPGTPTTTTPTKSTSQTWNWTAATDTLSGVASYIWRTTGTAIVTGTSAINSIATSLTEGIYNFFVKAVDTAGNQGAESSAGTVTVDTTAPVTTDSGIDTSWYNTPVTVTLTCSDVGGTGCANTYYTTDGTDPTTSSSHGNSFTLSTAGTHVIKYFSVDAANNSETVKTANNTVKIDTTAPIISSVVATPNNTEVTISWKTDKNCSSKINYGLTNNYGSSTLETDTFTRVTNHSVELTNLSTCTTYHYTVKSKDAATNENIDTDAVFTTTGCVGLVEAIATASAQIDKDVGGTLILQDDSSNGLTLTIPPDSFGNQDTNFQAHQLDTESILAVTSIPTGYSTAGNYIYELKALTGNATTVSTFETALTVRIAYDKDDILGLDESTFKIYRWDGNGWNQLSGCIVDTPTKTVTCTTTALSVFGLFGQTSGSGSSNLPSSNSSSSSVCTTSPPGTKAPWLYGAIPQDSGSIMLYFTPADSPVSTYVLEYGTKAGEYSYGILDMNVNSPKEMTFLVKSLFPNTLYYFKIRAGNGCAIGPWSNEISAKTKGVVSFNQLNIINSQLKIVPIEKTESVKNKQKESQVIPPIQSTGYDVNIIVVDINNKPVEGAIVTMHSKIQEAITDKNGVAKFKSVETGNHKVLIAYKNFEGEQSVNLTGNVKRFELNVTISPKTVLLSSLAYGIIGTLILVIIILASLLLHKKFFR